MRFRFHKSLILYILLLILAGVSFVQGMRNALRENGSQDFQWGPSRAILERTNPYAKYLDFKSGQIATSPYFLSQVPNYPASVYVFLFPYAVLPWGDAKAFWLLSNALFTLVIIVSLGKFDSYFKSPRNLFLLTVFFVMSTPYRNLLGNGQHTLFSLAFFMLAVLTMSKSDGLTGFLLAISWFKYTITLPLSVFFITKQKFAPIVVAGMVHITFTLLLSAWIGESPITLLLDPIRVASMRNGSGDLDFSSLAFKAGLPNGVALVAEIALMLLLAAINSKYRSTNSLLILSAFALSSYALFFHLPYDLVILIFPICYAMRQGIRRPIAIIFAICVFFMWYVGRFIEFFLGHVGIDLETGMGAVLFYAALAGSLIEILRDCNSKINPDSMRPASPSSLSNA